MASGTITFSKSTSSGSYIQGKIEWSATADKTANASSVSAKLYASNICDHKDTKKMVHIQILDTYHSSIFIRGTFSVVSPKAPPSFVY